MSIRKTMLRLTKVVSDEAEQNPEFAERLRAVLRIVPSKRGTAADSATSITDRRAMRRANRRPPAVLDPIDRASQGEESLRSALAPLSIDQLKDIVADFGMDQRRLAMKWKTRQRVVDHIVGISIDRAQKGDAFRS